MLKILLIVQCDVCADLFEQLSTCSTAVQSSCAISAADIIDSAEMNGWFYNSKTRQFWCDECVCSLNENDTLPSAESLKLPKFKRDDPADADDLPF
jgi:hypothetical protein